MVSSLRSLQNSVIRFRLGGSSADLRAFRQARRRHRHAPKLAPVPAAPAYTAPKKATAPAKKPGIVSRAFGAVSRLFSRKTG